ncbi:RNA polymerase sigma factor [Ktedonospora formicarum]|uniref:RNA polymerase sigma factor n=1 Tax=Ktedonospora formicarum TaxID=2778364 RepID=UPI003B75C892
MFNAPICTYIARLVGNDEWGRDLAQETFLKAWKGLPGIQGELQFRAWLYRIATNVAYSHLRQIRHVRWLPWIQVGENESPSIEGPEAWVSEIDVIQHILVRSNGIGERSLQTKVQPGGQVTQLHMMGYSTSSLERFILAHKTAFGSCMMVSEISILCNVRAKAKVYLRPIPPCSSMGEFSCSVSES